MRLFISLDLPEQPAEGLKHIQEQIRQEGLSMSKEHHITLKFLGEIEEKEASLLKEQLRKVKFKPITVSLGELGVFPTENYIRVIWAGIKPDEEVIKLQKQIHSLIGYPDDHKFSAHITVARAKYIKDKEKLIEMLNDTKLPEMKFQFDSFKLKKSTLQRGGPIYEDLEVFK